MQSKAHIRATNKWLAENRERVTVIVRSGDKAKIKAHAESKGKSINAYIVSLIEDDMSKGN